MHMKRLSYKEFKKAVKKESFAALLTRELDKYGTIPVIVGGKKP